MSLLKSPICVQMEKKLSDTQEAFKNYLTDIKLDSELAVTTDGAISFHWSNWNITCRMIKEGPLCLYTKEAIVSELDTRLEELRTHKIWVNNKLSTIESNVYDLYNFYMDPRVRQTWFGRKQSTLYSDESQKGPFTLLTSLKWKDRETFSYFVYKKILLESHQLRQFRLNSTIPFKFKFDEFELNDATGVIRQFNANGMLIQYNGRALKKKLQQQQDVRIEFDREHLSSVLKFLEVDQWPFADVCQFNVPCSILTDHFKLGGFEGADFFVFLPFHMIEKQQSARYLANLFKDLVFQVYSQFDEALAEELSTFHSWVKKVA